MTTFLVPITDRDHETRLRDAAQTLIDLCVTAMPTETARAVDSLQIVSGSMSMAVQSVALADMLQPGLPVGDRVWEGTSGDLRARLWGLGHGAGAVISAFIENGQGIEAHETFLSGLIEALQTRQPEGEG